MSGKILKQCGFAFLIAFAVAGTASGANAGCKPLTLKAYGHGLTKYDATMDAFLKWKALAKTTYGVTTEPAPGGLSDIPCKRRKIVTKKYNPLSPGWPLKVWGYQCTAAARPCN